MKRLIRKNSIPIREPLINESPLYNPLGPGEPTEFSDEKSYQRMFNQNTMRLIKQREEDNKK